MKMPALNLKALRRLLGTWRLALLLALGSRETLCGADPVMMSRATTATRSSSAEAAPASFAEVWRMESDPASNLPPSVLPRPDQVTVPQSDQFYLKLLQQPQDPDPPEPDISKPGPDMGDYPNSAFTLPKGRSYIEFAPFTYQTADPQTTSASYNFPFLYRYGITDNVEFRLLGSGLTAVYAPGDRVVGLSPLIVDTKIHLWDDKMESWRPAASLEVYLQTNIGSPEFRSGIQPSLNLNLDFPITKKTNIEMTFGYTGVQDAVNVVTGHVFVPRFHRIVPLVHNFNLDVLQFAYQWAIEQQVTDKFQVFVHGYYNGPILLQSGPGTVAGVGYFYQFSKRATMFNSYNFALDQFAAPFSTQAGLAFAF